MLRHVMELLREMSPNEVLEVCGITDANDLVDLIYEHVRDNVDAIYLELSESGMIDGEEE